MFVSRPGVPGKAGLVRLGSSLSRRQRGFCRLSDDRQLAFALDSDSYNDLIEESTVPRFLVVIATPDIGACWVRQRPSLIGLNAAAWWGRVDGEKTDNTATKTVHLPVNQRFNLDGLREMLMLG